MAKSLSLMIFTLTNVFCMKLLMLLPLNNIRGNINTFLMFVEPSFFQTKVPNIYWSHSIKLAVHIINKLPTHFLDNKSPYKMDYSTKLDFWNLKLIWLPIIHQTGFQGFKPNSTPQNRLVRWDLHLIYILLNGLISSRCGTSNTPPHAEVYSSRAWDKKLVGGSSAARYRVEQNVQESSLG